MYVYKQYLYTYTIKFQLEIRRVFQFSDNRKFFKTVSFVRNITLSIVFFPIL